MFFNKKANQDTIENLRSVIRFSKLIIEIHACGIRTVEIGENVNFHIIRGTNISWNKLVGLVKKIETVSVDISQKNAEKYICVFLEILLEKY